MKLLLEGRPGIGKTTVALRLIDRLREAGRSVTGFTTRELRQEGRRAGFLIEAVDGPSAVLAHVDLPGPPRVGRYGVDVQALERVALPALSEEAPVVVVDELGKMELTSRAFRREVDRLFTAGQDVVATVHLARDPFTRELRHRDDVEVIRVERANRDELPARIAGRLIG